MSTHNEPSLDADALQAFIYDDDIINSAQADAASPADKEVLRKLLLVNYAKKTEANKMIYGEMISDVSTFNWAKKEARQGATFVAVNSKFREVIDTSRLAFCGVAPSDIMLGHVITAAKGADMQLDNYIVVHSCASISGENMPKAEYVSSRCVGTCYNGLAYSPLKKEFRLVRRWKTTFFFVPTEKLKTTTYASLFETSSTASADRKMIIAAANKAKFCYWLMYACQQDLMVVTWCGNFPYVPSDIFNLIVEFEEKGSGDLFGAVSTPVTATTDGQIKKRSIPRVCSDEDESDSSYQSDEEGNVSDSSLVDFLADSDDAEQEEENKSNKRQKIVNAPTSLRKEWNGILDEATNMTQADKPLNGDEPFNWAYFMYLGAMKLKQPKFVAALRKKYASSRPTNSLVGISSARDFLSNKQAKATVVKLMPQCMILAPEMFLKTRKEMDEILGIEEEEEEESFFDQWEN